MTGTPSGPGESTSPADGDDEIAYASAAELGRRLRKREISTVELVDSTLRRIAALNPSLGAFLTVNASRARAEAAAADAAISKGSALGPLHGVPFSVKDLEATAEVRTTFGSAVYRDNVPSEDSIGVSRLRAAGAILVGKTNTPEFGLLGETKNRLGRDCRNPWNLTCTTGGSSGGAAAAVAAGLAPLAVGSDGAGSITAPSSFCGVFGLKPSTGRIPGWPIPANSRMFVATGPITRTVADAASMLTVMSGADPRDPISMHEPLLDFREAPARMNVAWSPDLGHFAVDAEVASSCEVALGAFRDRGWSVVEETPAIPDPWEAYMPLFLGDEWASLGPLVESAGDRFHPEALAEIAPGRDVTISSYIRALSELTQFKGTMYEFFARHDLLIMPATAVTAFPAGRAPDLIDGRRVAPHWTTFMPFPVSWNMTGQPAASVVCGMSTAGLPVGMLIVGRIGREDAVLAAARVIEEAFPWRDRRPPLAPQMPDRTVDEAVWL